MAITYGLTLQGLVIKTLQVVRSEVDDAIRSKLGNVPLGDRTLLGIYNGVWADRESSLWQLVQAVYSSRDPDKATGSALDAVCLLTGTFRPQASRSSSILILCGDPATFIPAASQIKTTSTNVVFQTTADTTLIVAPGWSSSATYAANAFVYWNTTGTNGIYTCILAVAPGTPPTSDPTHWLLVGNGTATATVNVLALNTGSLEAAATDLATIVSGITGWNSAYNQIDALKGRDIATDEELRLLREYELAAPGTSPIDAIRADILALSGVQTCNVFDNPTDFTNSDGMPPHTVEALVLGGDNQTIFDRLLASVAAGIATTSSGGGAQVGASTDSVGVSHVMKFSRPALKPIYVDFAITYDAKVFPTDGFSQIQTAITTAGGLHGGGYDAVASAIAASIFSVAGVLDVARVFISLAPVPTVSTTIPVGTRELATWAAIRITGTTTPGTP